MSGALRMNYGALITVEQIEVDGPGTLRPRETMFVAHGPDGYTWMLKRLTPEAAARDGLAYFMSTRVLYDGRWYIADEHGLPYADSSGKRCSPLRQVWAAK